jgi:hypothetical protein
MFSRVNSRKNAGESNLPFLSLQATKVARVPTVGRLIEMLYRQIQAESPRETLKLSAHLRAIVRNKPSTSICNQC